MYSRWHKWKSLRSWGPCLSRVSCCFLRLEIWPILSHFLLGSSISAALLGPRCEESFCGLRSMNSFPKQWLVIKLIYATNTGIRWASWLKCCRLFFYLTPYAYSALIHSTQGSGPAIQIVMSCCRLKPGVENRSDLKYIPCLTWIYCKEQHHQWNHFSWRIQQHHYLHTRQLYHTSRWWLDLWGSVILK